MPRPRVLVIEHDADCPPALFGSWLEDAGCTVTVCRPYEHGAGDPLPTLEGYDALLVLGGPMAATDPHPWLAPLRELVRDAAATGAAHARHLPGPPGLRGRVRRHRRAQPARPAARPARHRLDRRRRPTTRCSGR